MERRYCLDQRDPSLFTGRGIVADTPGDDEKLTDAQRHRPAIGFRTADAEEAAKYKKHLVLVLMRVPGELALNLGNFDVLIVDLTDDPWRPKLVESGAREFERDRGQLRRLLFEFGARRHRGNELVAETGADGNLVTALGAAAVENGGARLGLHAREEAVGLGAVAAVGLKGTLRHDKKLLRRVEHLLKLLGCCNNL